MKLELWLNKRTNLTHACSGFGPRMLCGVSIDSGHWQREQASRAVDDSMVECNRCRASMRVRDDGTAK